MSPNGRRRTAGSAQRGGACAAGAVGSAAGQTTKLQGCRVVGTCGSDAKCMYLVNELGFDAAISYRSQPLDDALDSACPDGIDVIFDNVGGEVLEAMLRRINLHARIAATARHRDSNE